MTGSERMAPLVLTSTSLVAIIWVLMVLGIRVYLRLKLNGPVSNDDYAAILATVLGVAQSSLVLVGVQLGLGGNIDLQDEIDRQNIMKFGYMSALLYLSATYVSRASSCLLYIRLTSTRSHLFAAFGGLLLSVFGGLACVLTVAFQCKMPKPWDGQDCVEVWALWCAIEISAIALEVFIFGISLLLVWSLRMRLKLKAMVVFAFSVRLLVVIPIALRLAYIRNSHISSESIYTSVAVTIMTTITTHIAIMSSTLPCLKQFLAMFESGMIGEYSDATYTGSGKGTRTDQSRTCQSVALSSLTSDGRCKKRLPTNDLQLRPNQTTGDSVAEVSADASSTISDRSSAAIIKRTQKWEVTYERW